MPPPAPSTARTSSEPAGAAASRRSSTLRIRPADPGVAGVRVDGQVAGAEQRDDRRETGVVQRLRDAEPDELRRVRARRAAWSATARRAARRASRAPARSRRPATPRRGGAARSGSAAAGAGDSSAGRGRLDGGLRLPVQGSGLIDPRTSNPPLPHLPVCAQTVPRRGRSIVLRSRAARVASRLPCIVADRRRRVAPADASRLAWRMRRADRRVVRQPPEAGRVQPPEQPRDAGDADPARPRAAGAVGAAPGRRSPAAGKAAESAAAAVAGHGRRDSGAALPGRGGGGDLPLRRGHRDRPQRPRTRCVDSFLRAYLVNRDDEEAALLYRASRAATSRSSRRSGRHRAAVEKRLHGRHPGHAGRA